MNIFQRNTKATMTVAFFAVQAMSPAFAQCPAALASPKFDAKGIARTETVRRDFDGNREAIQVRVDFAPGASFPKHSHPGVEIAYVLSGTIEYEMDGKTFRLQAGESLHIPAGAVHSARNVGAEVTSELATYLVEKNKPIVILDK